MDIPSPERLPRTADFYKWQGKPAALIPGRCAIVYEPTPRRLPCYQLVADGNVISAREFRILLLSQD